MPNIVTFHLQAAYNETIDSYASQQEQTLAPLCIIEPTTPLEAAKTVFVLSYLAENIQSTTDCRFAVKGGGQTALAGSANIGESLVLLTGHCWRCLIQSLTLPFRLWCCY